MNRREILQASMGGAVLGAGSAWADEDPSRALAPRPPMFPAKAKSIILLVTQGGMSQMDTFDPKPDLDKYHGKKLTPELIKGIGEVKTFFGGKDGSPLMRSPYKFRKRGESGMPV